MTARRAHALTLAGLVLAATGVWGVLGQQLDVPTVFGDELIYWDASRSLAAGDGLSVREGGYGFGPLYPAILAVIHLVAATDVEAYRIARLVNAALFSLAAVPVFLLARRVVPVRWAVGCAGLAVLAPSAVYTGFVMTEGLAYAAACLAFLACALVLERPTLARQLFALGAIALAGGLRLQLAVLGAALVLALALRWVLSRGWQRPGRSDLMLVWPILAACVLGIALVAFRGASGNALAGYDTLWRSYDPLETLRWSARALGGLGLYLGLVPLVVAVDAGLGLLREARAGSRSSAALLALAASTTLTLVLVVGAFSSTEFGVGFLHDRYLFYVVPFWIVGLAVWAERARPVSRLALGGGLAVSLAVVVPLAGSLLNKDGGRQFDAVASALPAEIAVRLGRNDPSSLMLVAVVVLAGLLAVVVPRRARWAVLALVAAVFVSNGALVWHARIDSAVNASFAELTDAQVGWVDAVVPADEQAVLVTGEVSVEVRDALRLTEFFNASIGRVIVVSGQLAPTVDADEGRVDEAGVVKGEDGSEVSARWVVAPAELRVAGTVVASGTTSGLRLWRTDGRLVLR